MRSLRISLLACAASFCFCAPRSAHARGSDQKQQCLAAYEDAQRSRKRGELLASVEKLRYCASSTCPAQMHADCEGWLREVEASLPSVVFRVRSAEGEELTAASVSIDGGHVQRLEGRALTLDPGEHEMVFECPGFLSLTRRMLFAEGEKLQEREVLLESATSQEPPAKLERAPRAAFDLPEAHGSPEPSQTRTNWLVPIVAASGVALVGGGGFAYFGLRARSADVALDSCTPNCTRDQVDSVKRDYLLANISLGAGIAGALATGTLLVLSRADGPKPSAAVRSTLLLGPTTVWTTTF